MKTVFTNGCFDLLHRGHVDLLERARALGDRLLVGINSDASVRSIKGAGKPFVDEDSRKAILLALRSVDEVLIFNELTPEQLIEEVCPDVLVKGGDWTENEIVGADFVRAHGGIVVSLPLIEGFSSSALVEKIRGPITTQASAQPREPEYLESHIEILSRVVNASSHEIRVASDMICSVIRADRKLAICGSGDGAAISQAFAANLILRQIPTIAFTTDTSALTAISNDFTFPRVFARQVEALMNPGDCLIVLGQNRNLSSEISAAMAARNIGCKVVAFVGSDGKKLAAVSDVAIMIPSNDPASVSDATSSVLNMIRNTVERNLEEGANEE